MKPRFQPDLDPGGMDSSRILVDPEACDTSDQQFAVSLEQSPRAAFEVDSGERTFVEPQAAVKAEAEASPLTVEPVPETESSELPGELPAQSPADPDAWRREVAARLNRYKSRRRAQSPRYPSLQLKFESTDAAWTSTASPPATPVPVNRLAVAVQGSVAAEAAPPLLTYETENSAKVLEFPRQAPVHHVSADELAGPVFDRPRIMEVPEVLPPPPALGGMLIEAEENLAAERRPGFELPLQTAPLGRRALASAIDVLLVVLAFAVFGYIFFRLSGQIPPWQQAAEVSLGLIATFWAGYQYLLLVYAGTTPGLKLARLRLSRFDGSPVPRRLRRWRVLASVLSGLSLALGYAWCFLDEDRLCWHDRITRTHMAPGT